MNGPLHFARAEARIDEATTARPNEPDLADSLVQEALVHAVLANTAAIVHNNLGQGSRGNWNEVLG